MKRSIFSLCAVVATCLLQLEAAAVNTTDSGANYPHRSSGSPATSSRVNVIRHRSSGSPGTDPRHVATVTAAPLAVTPVRAPPDAIKQRACAALLVALASDPAALKTIPDPMVRTFVSAIRSVRPLAHTVLLPRFLERWSANVHALCASTTTAAGAASSTTTVATFSTTPQSDPSLSTTAATSWVAPQQNSSSTAPPDTSSSTPSATSLTTRSKLLVPPLFIPWYAEHRISQPHEPVPSIPSMPKLFRINESL